MMYKLTVTIYSALWTWPPAAFVNEGLLDFPLKPDVGQHRGSRHFFYWKGESLQKENKFTNKQHEDRLSYAGGFAR